MVKTIIFLGLIVLSTLASCNHSDINLYRIQENGLYGFIDSTGTVVIEPQYKYVSSFNLYGYATVITEYSLKNEQGKYGGLDTLLHVKYGFIDKSNTLVVDTVHTLDLSATQMQQMGLHQIYKKYSEKFINGALGFNDIIDGKAIQIRAGQHLVQNSRTRLIGYMNLSGDTTIAAKYNACNPFYGGVASVLMVREIPTANNLIESLNSVILIDSLGKVLTKDKYFIIPNFSGVENSWSCKLMLDETNNPDFVWLLLDKNGRVCSDSIRCTRVYNADSDYYIWQQSLFDTPFYSYINKKGSFLTDFDHDGTISLSNEAFTDVTSFTDTIAGVKVRYGDTPCWTFVNKEFDFISQPFDSVSFFSEGLVAVKEFSTGKTNSKWGFVDRHFKEVIPYKYDKVGTFIKGLAYFKIGGIEGYINKSGKVVWHHTVKN